jgi:hypothetical protein
MLDQAQTAFYNALDTYTLADTHTDRTQAVILRLHRQSQGTARH